MKKHLIIFLLFSTSVFCQEKTDVEIAYSKFLVRDFKASDVFYTMAICKDSSIHENYYLRGVTRLYLNDTLGAINDFKEAAYLKRWQHKFSSDSLIIAIMASKPRNRTHQQPLDHNLYQIQLATWLFLKKTKISKACRIYRNLTKQGFKDVYLLLDSSICTCC